MEYTIEKLNEYDIFRWFTAISSIPRGSGNTAAVAEFIDSFAEERSLPHLRDGAGNVIVKKPASPGKADSEPLMLQGHIDMVCAVEDGRDIDMSVTPPRLVVDGGWLRADGTTLGADNGIAVAMMLALLDSSDAVHPPLVCVFTADEETGMDGAYGLDKRSLGARRMLNLDAETAGVFFAGCAGGNKAVVRIPVTSSDADGDAWRIELVGLAGGHSGIDIDRGRAMAPMLMGRVLLALRHTAGVRCVRFDCGHADNAIAERAEAEIVCRAGHDVPAVVRRFEEILRAEYGMTEPALRLHAGRITRPPQALDGAGTDALICLLLNAPQGVMERSAYIAGMPQTSSNLGIVRADKGGIYAEACIRSAIATQQDWINLRFASLAASLGGTTECCRGASAWEFAPDSPLRDECIRAWEDMFGEKPVVKISHAGAECGVFVSEMPGLDCVALGPNIENAHTPRERLDIESAKRIYSYLKYVLLCL